MTFDEFYKGIYQERWENLKSALVAAKNHVALLNPHCKSEIETSGWEEILEGAFYCHEGMESPLADENNLLNYYLLDAASVLAARALDVQEGDKVLDMCAAPGGKSLTTIFLNPKIKLTSNDRSAPRRNRLIKVFESYLPKNLQESVTVTGHDTKVWCLYEKEAYDKILLDVPCSSERHLLEKGMKDWKVGRTKRLSKEQYTMISSAAQVLKAGGKMVYSTCSISTHENDDVIEKFLKRNSHFSLERVELPFGEKTEFGNIVLPDNSLWGPIYFSVLKKDGNA